jgi:hypothetical protein
MLILHNLNVSFGRIIYLDYLKSIVKYHKKLTCLHKAPKYIHLK